MRLYISNSKDYVDVDYYDELCTEAAEYVHSGDYKKIDVDGHTCYIVSDDTAKYWERVESLQYNLDAVKNEIAEAVSDPKELTSIYNDINEAADGRDLDDGLQAAVNAAKDALQKVAAPEN